MNLDLLIAITSILVLGIVAQWLAWRINVPSILVLMLFGFLIGPVTNFIKPDILFGDLLFPIISLSVAVILYEGGLSLKFSESRKVKKILRNLIFIGIGITWILSATAAFFILHLDMVLSILLAAILVVTGPTVILPLLRLIRPTGQINSILKWEGILNDPIGALLAVLVFEGILIGGIEQVTTLIVVGLLKTILFGGGLGLLGYYVIIMLIKHRWIPEFLQNPASLTLMIAVFTASNSIQPESGLFAVTIMGIFLSNQRTVAVHHIIEFKENLRVLLISVLFIILVARLEIGEITSLGIKGIIFLAVLILIIRPAATLLSTIKSGLTWREKFFLSSMAPRGIVAAVIASLFAFELSQAGYPQAERLVPITFLVIIGTILVYGLSAMPLARMLGIADSSPQGCLIIGAHPLARDIARKLKEQEVKVLLIDTNVAHINAAHRQGLPAYHGSVLSETIPDEVDLTGIGRLLAITPNQEVNTLAGLYFEKIFGKNEVYHLANEEHQIQSIPQDLQSNLLFGSSVNFSKLEHYRQNGAKIKVISITEKLDYQVYKEKNRTMEVIPLFLVDDKKKLIIITNNNQPTPQPNQVLISLMNPKRKP
jgi:NhaP-type Na+/H+ or K+/H+ antiporter